MIPTISTYQVAARIQFGIGASLTVGQEIKKLGYQHAFVVTDQGVKNAGLLGGVQQSLTEAGVAITLFDQVQADPGTRNVNQCADDYLRAGCDILIAIGGGSVLDCAKAAGVVVANGGRFEDFLLQMNKKVEKHISPLITIPTTAGTGSEVSPAVVITHEKSRAKIGFLSPMLNPIVALVDPELTRSMPPRLTASSGFDALCHGIERYTSTTATPLNDFLSLGCIKMTAENLRQAYANPNNIKAREGMMWAGLLGGMSRANISAGHIISAVVGAYIHIPHGVACALLQPPTMEFNLIANPHKFVSIAEAMGENVDNLSIMDAAQRSIMAVERLMVDVGLRQGLRDFGLREEQIPDIAQTCMKMRGTALRTQNPRMMTTVDIEEVLRQCY